MTRRSVCSWGGTLVMARALAVGSVCASPSHAANQLLKEADLERAFQVILADPADLDAAFEYERFAAVLGNFEAAISSLERMLMFDADLLQLHVELGVLCFR